MANNLPTSIKNPNELPINTEMRKRSNSRVFINTRKKKILGVPIYYEEKEMVAPKLFDIKGLI